MNKFFLITSGCCATLLAGISCSVYLLAFKWKSNCNFKELSVSMAFECPSTSLLDSGTLVWLDEEDKPIRILNIGFHEQTTNAIRCDSVLLTRMKRKPISFVVIAGGTMTTNSFSKDSGVYYTDWIGDIE